MCKISNVNTNSSGCIDINVTKRKYGCHVKNNEDTVHFTMCM